MWKPGKTLKDVEREAILTALEHHDFNRAKTAHALGQEVFCYPQITPFSCYPWITVLEDEGMITKKELEELKPHVFNHDGDITLSCADFKQLKETIERMAGFLNKQEDSDCWGCGRKCDAKCKWHARVMFMKEFNGD